MDAWEEMHAEIAATRRGPAAEDAARAPRVALGGQARPAPAARAWTTGPLTPAARDVDEPLFAQLQRLCRGQSAAA